MPTSRATPQQTARRLIGAALTDPERVPQLPATELDLLLRIARRVKLLARLAAQLRACDALDSLPITAVDQLRSALVTAESRARLVTWEMNRIAWALGEEDPVDVLVLKGCAYLLHELPNARSRLITDVDLMVAERHLDHIERRLSNYGWRTSELSPYDDNYYRRWTHELPPMIHVEREVEVDLHHSIIARTARLKPNPELLLRDVRAIDGSSFETLSRNDMTLHAMTHLMFDSDLADALRDLVDIGDLVQHFSELETDFWEALLRRADELGLNRPLYYSLRYATRLLDTPVPAAIMGAIARKAPARPVVWLMDRLVPRALLPEHPDHPSRTTALARLLLYMRSHWIRMPPFLLVRHLSYKFYVRRLRPRFIHPEQELAPE